MFSCVRIKILFNEYKYFGLNSNIFYWMQIHFLKYQIFFTEYKYNFIEYKITFLLRISNHTSLVMAKNKQQGFFFLLR